MLRSLLVVTGTVCLLLGGAWVFLAPRDAGELRSPVPGQRLAWPAVGPSFEEWGLVELWEGPGARLHVGGAPQEAIEGEPVAEQGEIQTALHTFVVQSSEGLVLVDAGLRLFRPSWGDPFADETTDRDGRAALPARPGDEVRAHAEGYLLKRFTLPGPPWPDPYPITLAKGTRSLGGVLVDDLGLAVPEAAISLALNGRTIETVSAQDGGFRLHLPDRPAPPLEGTLRVSHPGHYFPGHDPPFTIPADMGERRLELVLLRWARALVRVVDAEGEHVPGVSVQLAGPPGDPERWLLPPGYSGSFTTSEANELEIELPPGCPFWLIAKHPAFETKEIFLGEMEPSERAEVEVVLAGRVASPTMAFQVVDPDGEPIPGAEVGFFRETAFSRLSADEQGLFRVVPPAETWRLVVQAAGHRPLEREWVGIPRASEEPERLVLQPGGPSLRVSVRDADGKAVPDAVVRVREQPARMDVARRTGEDGTAVFSGLFADRAYRVDIGSGQPGAYFHRKESLLVPDPPAHRDIRPGGEPLRFTLVAAGSIEGMLRGKDLEGSFANLSCMGSVAGPGTTPLFTLGAAMDEQGTFHFGGLPPGRYRLWTERPGAGGSFSQPLAAWELGAGEHLRVGAIGE